VVRTKNTRLYEFAKLTQSVPTQTNH